MMDEQVQISFQKNEKGFQLEGLDGEAEWTAQMLSQDHVLLKKYATSNDSMRSFATTSVDIFAATLIGLCKRGFSGSFIVYQPECQRRLYFRHGKLVFARSNLMDDRLGEVMYRAGLLTLDQMMEAAVQVTRTNRFGKVLIDAGSFDSPGLWDALKLQIRNIFYSIFFHDSLTYQQLDDLELSRSSVIFEQDMEDFIEEAVSQGHVLRTFLARLTSESEVRLLDSSRAKAGTFLGDMVEMVSHSTMVKDIVSESKLCAVNTYAALLDLESKRVISIENVLDRTQIHSSMSGTGNREIKSLIDAYSVIVSHLKDVFIQENQVFPIDELNTFLERQYERYQSPLFLTSDGYLTQESVRNIYASIQFSETHLRKVSAYLEGLIRYLLQHCSDALPNRSNEIVENYRSLGLL